MTGLINQRTSNPWTKREIQYLLRVRNLEVDETNSSSFSYDCIEDHAFGGARARLSYSGYHEKWELTCRICMREGIESPLQRLEEWLNSHQLDSNGLRPHYNPMEENALENRPWILKDQAGRFTLYKGLIHILYGKPGTLKSWLALSLVQECNARFWDFENGVAVSGARLRALGTPRELAGVFDSPASRDAIQARIKEYSKNPPELLVIDGFSGLAGVLGIDPDSNQDVLGVFTELFAPLRKSGVTVLVLDHLPKESSVEDYPIGAQAKKSQSDVTLLVKMNARTAHIELFVAKDRIGELAERCEPGPYPRLLGQLALEQGEERVFITLEPFQEAHLGDEPLGFAEARSFQAIWDFVSANEDCSQSQIEQAVKGRRESLRDSIEKLVNLGYLTRKQISRTLVHNVSRPLDLRFHVKGWNSKSSSPENENN